jgi:hypothetical protein
MSEERDSFRKTAAQFEEFVRETEVPPAILKCARPMSVLRMLSKVFCRSWEKSFDAADRGAVALNRKIVDIAQRNINSSFNLAKNAGAKNPAEAMEIQSSYWRINLIRSPFKPKRCALSRHRWQLTHGTWNGGT